jgi:hypothetical protein
MSRPKPAEALYLRDFVTLRKHLIRKFSPLRSIDNETAISIFRMPKLKINLVEICVSIDFKSPCANAFVVGVGVMNSPRRRVFCKCPY